MAPRTTRSARTADTDTNSTPETTQDDNAKQESQAATPDFVQDHKDPETGDTVKVLDLATAQDEDKLKEALKSGGSDDLDYDYERTEQRVREAAAYRQTLDVRDPALSQPVVFVGNGSPS